MQNRVILDTLENPHPRITLFSVLLSLLLLILLIYICVYITIILNESTCHGVSSKTGISHGFQVLTWPLKCFARLVRPSGGFRIEGSHLGPSRQSTALQRTESDPVFQKWKQQDEETVHTLRPSALRC